MWGNTKNENLLRLLRVQKRCARLILDASFSDNSVELFSKLGWLPIDDVIRIRKLCLRRIPLKVRAISANIIY